MPTHFDDRILWTLVGLGLLIAAKAVPANLQYVRQLTQEKAENEPAQPSNEDVEHALKTDTLQKLAGGRSYEIRSSAIKIIAERCINGPSLPLLLEDLAGTDPDRRDEAIHAMKLFVSHRSVQDSRKLFLLTTKQASHAMITALINLLPQHENVSTGTTGDKEGEVKCYLMEYGLPVMSESHYKAFMKRAEQLAGKSAESPKERAVLCRISGRQKQLLALTGLTPLTEFIFNENARHWLRENEISVVTLNRVPDIPDEFHHYLSNSHCSIEETEGLSGWRLTVSADDRSRHVELLLKALWSSGSLAVQASSLQTATSTERDAIKNTGGRDIYDAYCQERAAFFRQLIGGSFEQAFQSANKGSAMTRGNAENEIPCRNVLPPSPIRPSHRPPQERTLLLILLRLLNLNSDYVETALGAGLVSRWLYRYPFPCMLTSSKQHDVVAFLREKAWGSDDPVMADLMHIIPSVLQGQKQLRKYGLTKITDFHAYREGGDLYGEPASVRAHDVVMTGGEDTAGILPYTAQSGWDQRPWSSWSRSHAGISSSEAIQRRRRREAMVLSDGDEPLTEGNILQRENSRVALVPGESPDVEELTQLIRAINRDDEDAVDQTRASWAGPGSQRPPLADITGLDH